LAYPASPNKRSEEEGTDNATQTKKQPETAKKKKKKERLGKRYKKKNILPPTFFSVFVFWKFICAKFGFL
jgi:hypothetical protein